MMKYSRDVELLFEVGSLRYMSRGWIQHLATHCANDLEHTTESARHIWKEIQTADPASWHMKTNKWKGQSHAGT